MPTRVYLWCAGAAAATAAAAAAAVPYHTQYLKSIRLERNRKTGFKCPRGCGKGTQHSGPCPGKIDKSHPIHPRNEEQKKKKKVRGLVGARWAARIEGHTPTVPAWLVF